MSQCPEGPFENTDRELWREVADDYYAPSLHVTKDGGIGINVGGHVYVKPLRAWHALASKDCPFPTLLDTENLAKPSPDRTASWFWHGRYEGAHGGYVPPPGLWPGVLYLIGHEVGRRFGPPAPRRS